MSTIIHNFTSWAKQHDSATLTQWKSARKKLQSEEQYLLVLIGLADGSLTPLRSSSETSVFKLGLAIGVIGSVAIIALRVIWILIRR